MTETITLDAPPKNGSLYVKAALGAVPLPFVAGRAPAIPDRAVRLEGLRVDPGIWQPTAAPPGYGSATTCRSPTRSSSPSRW